ncbi:hypothetical protein CRG98_018113 [Punica granatum]|uniref:Uncharacterized protein n=1 Tax=Punica granatum TaxID=22663 RepID=A0A2I0JYS9_PUNGR|nr:hypothetical protein CRG98_018113 [Punica granatum]
MKRKINVSAKKKQGIYFKRRKNNAHLKRRNNLILVLTTPLQTNARKALEEKINKEPNSINKGSKPALASNHRTSSLMKYSSSAQPAARQPLGQAPLNVQQPLINWNNPQQVIQEIYEPTLRRVDRLLYRKPYPDWIDRVHEFPRGIKMLDFSPFFSGEDVPSFKEQIARFLSQYNVVATNDYLKLRLFSNSLTG